MAKKVEKINKKKEISGNQNNKWSVSFAANEDEIKELLDDDWEPFSVDMGLIYFKKKKG